jgi:hypothetical protein
VTSNAPPLPESSGCRTCHQQDAETDQVFTQFYPVLRSFYRFSGNSNSSLPKHS